MIFFIPKLVKATDYYWTNNGTAGDFTNTLNWLPGAVVPTSTDNANFTNSTTSTINWSSSPTVANAFFDMKSGTKTINISNSTWFVTNSFIIGQNAGSTSAVTQSTGTLIVTNNLGTASLVVGYSGRGTYTMSGATVISDTFYNTNQANSTLTMNSGTLTILNGSTISNFANIGNTSGQTFQWNILGGTNFIAATGSGVEIGNSAGATGIVIVSGPQTVWTNIATINVGNNGYGQFYISNGAKVFGKVTMGRTGASNIVSMNNGTMIGGSTTIVGNNANSVSNLFIVENGSFLGAGDTRIGIAAGANLNTMIVRGVGTIFTNQTTVTLGQAVNSAQLLVVSNGATVINQATTIGVVAGCSTNTLIVSDSGTLYTNTAGMTVGLSTSFKNLLMISNGATVHNGVGNIGGGTSTSNNVIVTDSGTKWINDATLTCGNGGTSNNLSIVNSSSVSALAIVVGGSVSSSNNVMFLNSGASISSGANSSLIGSIASNNLAVIANAVWTNTSTLSIGDSVGSSLNSLIVTNGGIMVTDAAIIGNGSGASFNTALISDTGSRWSNAVNFTVGSSGFKNSLVLSNAASIYTGGTFSLGVSAGATNNTFTMYDSAALTALGLASIGASGSNCTMNMLNGSPVFQSGGLTVGAAGQLIVSNCASANIKGSLRISSSAIITAGQLHVSP